MRRLAFRMGAFALVLLSPTRTAAQGTTEPQVTRTEVEVREASGLAARLSPDGRELAFLMLGSVFVADQATGRARAVIDPRTTPTLYYALSWAPDTRRLALLAFERPGTLEGLVVVDVATSARTIVSSLADLADVAWAPDGTLLVTRAVADSVEIRRYPAVANGAATVLRRLPRGAGQLAVAPDGRRVVHASAVSPATGLPTARSEIVEIDLATGARSVLASAGGLDAHPTFSPDGQWLAFLSLRDGTPQVWVASRDGGSPRALTAGMDDVLVTPLSWTPDSRAVVFAAQGRAHAVPVEGGPPRELPFTATLSVAQWSGLRRPELSAPGSVRTAEGLTNPILSPDGRVVVFSALGDLWLASTAGGRPDRLTDTPARDELPTAWAPDSRQILYTVQEPGRAPAYLMRDVTRPEPGTPLPSPGMPGAWSPDGRLVAFMEAPGPAGPPRLGWIDVASHEVHHIRPPPGMVEGIWFSPGSDTLRFMVAADGVPDSLGGFRPARRLLQAVLRDSAPAVPWRPGSSSGGVLAVWSADGRRVAWSEAGVGYWHSVDSAERPVRLTDPTPRAFSWSADGESLLYLSHGRLRLLMVRSGVARTLDVAPSYRVAPDPPPLVLRQVRVVDGRGTLPSDPVDVLVEGGRITRIGRGLAVNSDTREIEGAGRMVLPGLFDLHVHLFGGQAPSPLFLHHGVTTIRDLGTRGEWTRSQRERAEQGVVPMPRIVMSAGQLTADVGVGLRGDGLYREEAVADPAAVTAAAASLRAQGADVIKNYWMNLTFEGLAVDAAHAVGLPVTTHYLSLGAFARGLEGKEHANFYFLGDGWTTTWREDALTLSRAAGTCITPTLANYLWLTRGRSPTMAVDSTLGDDEAIRRYTYGVTPWPPLPPATQALWDRRFALSIENVRRMRAAGLRVATGTDIGPEGWSLHAELELLVKAGFTPVEAIRAATLEAATCVGLGNSLGSIEPGKIADLVLVDGDPSHDIRDARRVTLVILGGRPVSRADLAATWAAGTSRP